MNYIVLFVHICIAGSIPSVFCEGQACATPKQCLDRSCNTECCVQNSCSGDKTCQKVDASVLETTYDSLQTLPGTNSSINELKPTIQSLNAGHPLHLNSSVCTTYNRAQLLVAQGGNLPEK